MISFWNRRWNRYIPQNVWDVALTWCAIDEYDTILKERQTDKVETEVVRLPVRRPTTQKDSSSTDIQESRTWFIQASSRRNNYRCLNWKPQFRNFYEPNPNRRHHMGCRIDNNKGIGQKISTPAIQMSTSPAQVLSHTPVHPAW